MSDHIDDFNLHKSAGEEAQEREHTSRVFAEVDRQKDIEALLNQAKAYYFSKEMPKGDMAAAEWLIAYRSVKTDRRGKIYAYNPQLGHYKAEGETLLKADLIEQFNTVANRARVGEILAKVQALSYCDEEILEKSTPAYLLPLENGIFNINTGSFLPHSPEYFFTYKHPVAYEPNAQSPLVLKFLGEIVTNDTSKEVLLDIAALCLYRERITRHFFVLYGKGHNGKSLYLTILKTFLGKNRVVSITPQALSEDVFAGSQLCDKHANLGADIPGGVIQDTAIVKSATGGDGISVQRKGVDREEREIYTEFVWGSNDPPRIVEDTYAIWDRLKVITFPYTFVEEPIAENERKAIPDLEAQLVTPSELSGLLNLCIQRLPKLIQTRKLSVPHSPEQTRRQYRTLSDTPAVFVDDACEEVEYEPYDGHTASSGYITADEGYKAYKAWCRKNNVVAVSSNRFGRTMEKLGYEKGRDNQQRSYRGLKLRSDSTHSNDSLLFLPVREKREEKRIGEIDTFDTTVSIENFDFPTKVDVLQAIRTMPNGEIQQAQLESLFPGETKVRHWINELLMAGDIYEPKSGMLKIKD